MKSIRRLLFCISFIVGSPISVFCLLWYTLIEVLLLGLLAWILVKDDYLKSEYITNLGLLGLWWTCLDKILKD